jgi:hypothetical protein
MARMIQLILLAAAAGFCGSAQQIPIRGNSFRVEPHTTIRLDANLVLVPVTVTDSRGSHHAQARCGQVRMPGSLLESTGGSLLASAEDCHVEDHEAPSQQQRQRSERPHEERAPELVSAVV